MGLLLAHVGCGSESEGGSKIGDGGKGGKGGSGGSTTGGSGGTLVGGTGGTSVGGTGGTVGIGGSGGTPDFDACAGDEYMADAEPVDMFIMLDQSVSMNNPTPGGQSIWQAVTGALKQFVDDPNSAGIRVGIQYFGLPQTGGACGISCNPADYAVAEVAIAELPGVAGAIKNSLDMHGPSSFTPTGPALAGALQHAQTHAAANPDRLTVVVFATDGYPAVPSQCDPCGPPTSLNEIRTVAEMAALGSPKVLTFVIGIGGVANLNGIAASGGTGQAFLIDDTMGDVGAEFAQAMRSIATSPLSCEYALPQPEDGGVLKPDLVNVRFTPPGGASETLPRVNDVGDCGSVSKGWFYETDMSVPVKIVLCPNSCDSLGAGRLEILLGCTTVTGPN